MIEVKLNSKLEQEVEEIFLHLGISKEEAIRLFFEQVSHHKGLPFDTQIHAKVLNDETIQAIEDAKNHKLIPITLAEINAY